jgi:hypothetical protein
VFTRREAGKQNFGGLLKAFMESGTTLLRRSAASQQRGKSSSSEDGAAAEDVEQRTIVFLAVGLRILTVFLVLTTARTAELLKGFAELLDFGHPIAEGDRRDDEFAFEVADFDDAAILDSDAGEEDARVVAGMAWRNKRVADAVFYGVLHAIYGGVDFLRESSDAAENQGPLEGEIAQPGRLLCIFRFKHQRGLFRALGEPRAHFAKSADAILQVGRSDDGAVGEQEKFRVRR